MVFAMRIFLYVVTFLLACAAAAFLYGRFMTVKTTVGPEPAVKLNVTGFPQYREEPPADALKGTIRELTGTAMLYPRTGEMPEPASQGAVLLQGDSLAASPSSSVTAGFNEYLDVTIKSETSVSFAN